MFGKEPNQRSLVWWGIKKMTVGGVIVGSNYFYSKGGPGGGREWVHKP